LRNQKDRTNDDPAQTTILDFYMTFKLSILHSSLNFIAIPLY
jgi:hypothetical protein